MKRRSANSQETSVEPNTGSPTPGEPVYLAVGRLRRSHGLEGDLWMEVLTDFPERLRTGKTVYVGEDHLPMRLVAVRKADRELIVRFSGYSTPEEASRLTNSVVYVPAKGLPKLPEGVFYHHELLGLKIVDEAGQSLGVLDHILETGSNDVYVVKTAEGKDLLLPAIEEVVLSIDLGQGTITVRPQEWY